MNEEDHVSTHLWAFVTVFLIDLPFESMSSDGLARAQNYSLPNTMWGALPPSSCIYSLLKRSFSPLVPSLGRDI